MALDAGSKEIIEFAVKIALESQGAQHGSLNEPFIYVLVVGFLAAVSIFVNLVLGRIRKNEQDLETERERNILSMKCMEDKFYNSTVHKNDCKGKQDLWGERVDNVVSKLDGYLDQNERDHASLVETLEKNTKANIAQIAELAERISELSECVKNLELGKEC